MKERERERKKKQNSRFSNIYIFFEKYLISSRFDFVLNGKYEKQLQNEILSQRERETVFFLLVTVLSNQLVPFNVSIDEIEADEAVGN